MSKECYYCGFRDPLPFTCKFCGNTYCYSHRLPESHDCTGLVLYKKKVRDSGKLYQYEPDLIVRKSRKPAFKSLANVISLIKSNYSLTILTLVIISFVLQNIFGHPYERYLVLYPSEILTTPWILVTHMFLHAGPVHLLFNMIFLFFFGPELERRIGGKRFLEVFFISGIIAALGYSLWSVFVIGRPGYALGASGALFGIFACLAVLAPHIRVYIYFVPMKITHALILFALLDLVLIGSGDPIARSAHLSGVLAGLIMGNWIKKTGDYISY